MDQPDTLRAPLRSRFELQLETWTNELINFTRGNKLLNFKHSRTSSLELVYPDPSAIDRRLNGSGWRFFIPSDVDVDTVEAPVASVERSAQPDELVTGAASADDIDKVLRNLERVSAQAHIDTGVWILYLGLGVLRWVDPDDGKTYESPLLLRPVELTRESFRAPFRLVDNDEDAMLNQALVLKLAKDFDITLPSVEDLDPEPSVVCDAVARAIAGRRGWSVEERAVLSTFTFHKEAMYRDLLDNRERISSSPLVQVLALGQDATGAQELSFDAPREDTLDVTAPAEAMVSVCDADSTQRACIVAAREGRSFVMDGPPGSGKSQTITNMIAELLHAGRSVLFVSEKAAALDVVHNRLADANLSEFVLELHSHKAKRKEVAIALGRALETRPHLHATFSESDSAQLANLRTELNDYATAMNVRRMPLGRSLHDVLGRIIALHHHPRGPVATAVGAGLTVEQLNEILDAAHHLGRAWGPIERPHAFLWRDLTLHTLTGAQQQAIEEALVSARRAVDQLRSILDDVDSELGLGWSSSRSDGARLLALLKHLESNPRRAQVPPAWFTDDDLDVTDERLDALERVAAEHAGLVAVASALVGDSWRAAPVIGSEAFRKTVWEILSAEPPMAFVSNAQRPALAAAIGAIETLSIRLQRIESGAIELETRLGLDHVELTDGRLKDLVELAAMLESPDRPERAWLDPLAQAALTEAEAVLSSLVREFRARRDHLRSTFDDGVIELDLAVIRDRLQSTRGLRKLSSAYRADKKLLATRVVGGKVSDEALTRLDEAVEWREESLRLDAAEAHHQAALGRYYAGRLQTDLDRLTNALSLARHALTFAGGRAPAELQEQLSADAPPQTDVLEVARRLRADVHAWRTTDRSALASMGIDISVRSLHGLRAWTSDADSRLRLVEAVLIEVERATAQSLDVAQSERLMTTVGEILAIETDVEAALPVDQLRLGPNYVGLAGDLSTVRGDLQWARTTRHLLDGLADPLLAGALLSYPPISETLRMRLVDMDKSWRAIADHFEPGWRGRLTEDFDVSLEDGGILLKELYGSMSDIDEWGRFARAQRQLKSAFLAPVVEFVEQQAVPAAAVSEIIERSVLEGWSDAVITADKRLRNQAPTEREDLVGRFRDLDRRQVRGAASRVVEACSARRPSTTVGAAGTIRREAEKKKRHMPIRDLLAHASDVALALKPCFMMSPLTVSQFLPPTMVFDVVIFDEASQVKPSDAINCIYRGRQLIVAGDPKQLPPTSFFDQLSGATTDEYDSELPDYFESVLDGFRGSGLPTLPLRWHYRSQHEALITYSNYKFYDGRLLTFPSAVQAGDDVGITFHKVNGVYRRGGARDNPIEAAKVVERVLFHRRANPELTLGVVAFSSAQESAISAEIERQAHDHPELNELIVQDRLDGFFVKNLENVQGDERDIILFSIGYGPDENGRFTEQLGPLGMAGGERRLNVAITRARRRVEVISSITAGDFPGTSQAPGIRHLQRYLDFAERGMAALAIDVEQGHGDAESPFEEEVIRTIRSMGYEVVPQVGVAGFRIDMGIKHPARPGEFALGIECDGAAYHSSKVARDRDRLRQEILERLGWRIHRVWGPAWYRNRAAQEAVLLQAIESAIAGRDQRIAVVAPKQAPEPALEIRPAELDRRPDWAQPYRVAQANGDYGMTESEFVSTTARPRVVQAIGEIVSVEGPIHEDTLRRRIQEWFGISRMTATRRAAFDEALASSQRMGRSQRVEGGSFLSTARTETVVRVPALDGSTERSVCEIAPSERQQAIRRLVEDTRRVTSDELLVAFARLFGWRRSGNDIRMEFERDLFALLRAGEIVERDGSITTA